jgi:hypothetical protein|tara:strand:+ start:620 stop:859 length:240 start_codon:yes stop_codon:yes gene_type:complete
MKKKVKKMMEWFYDESYRGGQNIAECKNLYDLVEKLQCRLEDVENDYLHLCREIAIHRREIGRLQGILDTLESRLPDED